MRRDRIPRGSERSDSAASSSGCTKRAKSRYPASGAPEKEKRKPRIMSLLLRGKLDRTNEEDLLFLEHPFPSRTSEAL
jgi:hypothetical protein